MFHYEKQVTSVIAILFLLALTTAVVVAGQSQPVIEQVLALLP